jgi:hypothetical protein
MSNSGNYIFKGQGLNTNSSYGAIPITGLTLDTNQSKMNLPGTTFKITPANGGSIITVSEERSTKEQFSGIGTFPHEELYIIPDGVEDFDRELGKIITIHRMKQQHE